MGWWTILTFKFSSILISLIQNTRIMPNHLTLMSLSVAIAACLLIAFGNYPVLVAAAILLQIAWILDLADGLLARYKRIFSPFGPWLDSTSDRIKEFLIILSLSYRYSQVSNKALFFGLYSLFLIFIYHGQEKLKLPFTAPESKEDIKNKEGKTVKKLNIIRDKFKLIPFGIGEQYFLFSLFLVFNRIDLFFYFFTIYGSIVTIAYPLYKYYHYRLNKCP